MKIIREYALKWTMDGLSDDVLSEILVRLPDSRSAIQSSSVCKRWRSLIMNDDFKTMFAKHHGNDHDDNVLLFDYTNLATEASLLHQLPPPQHQQLMKLSPLNGDARLFVAACCGDLVLLSRHGSVRHYFLYNWVTKDFLPLPEIPSPCHGFIYFQKTLRIGGYYGYSMLRDPNDLHNFRIVLLYFCMSFEADEVKFSTAIFDHTTREWTFPKFQVPCVRPKVCCNNIELAEIVCASHNPGTLHWLFGVDQFYGLIAFDVFGSKARLLRLPADNQLLVDICPRVVKGKVRLADVQGRLRLSRMVKISDTCFGLRIWELLWDISNNNNDKDDDDVDDDYSWHLVHDVGLKVKPSTTMFFVLAMDPADGNVIYLVQNKDIFRYRIRQHEYESHRVSGFPRYRTESVDMMEERVGRYLRVFNIEPPSWPSTSFFA